jgi:tight adherence protein C
MVVGVELIVVFLAVFGGAFVALQWLQGQPRLDERHKAARDEGTEPGDPGLVLGDMTPVLAAQIPMSEEGEKELRPELREAGFYAPTALMQYAAIRALLMLLPLVVAVLLALVAPRNLIPHTFAVGILISALGFALPRAYINRVARARKRQIERGLPVAVDMLALAMTAGQTLFAALERVAGEIRFSFPVLSRELEIVRHHARLRSLDFALRDWADRVRIPEVRQLVAILASADRLGRDVCSGLLEFSDHYRTTQRQRADAQANRASVLLIFPMLVGLWLPAAVILVAPILFQFHQRGAEAAESIRKSNEKRHEMDQKLKRIQDRMNPKPTETTTQE